MICENDMKFECQCPQLQFCLCMAYGCFHATEAELHSCWPAKPKYLSSGPLQKKYAHPWLPEGCCPSRCPQSTPSGPAGHSAYVMEEPALFFGRAACFPWGSFHRSHCFALVKPHFWKAVPLWEDWAPGWVSVEKSRIKGTWQILEAALSTMWRMMENWKGSFGAIWAGMLAWPQHSEHSCSSLSKYWRAEGSTQQSTTQQRD